MILDKKENFGLSQYSFIQMCIPTNDIKPQLLNAIKNYCEIIQLGNGKFTHANDTVA